MKPKNTTVSRLAFGEWRLPPADRSDGEVKKYYLSPEELEKYQKGGAQKVEKRRTVKQVLEEEYLTGKKTLEQIADELGMQLRIIKANAARLGFIEKKTNENDIKLDYAKFHGKLSYTFKNGKIIIRQDSRKRIVIDLNEVDIIKEGLSAVAKQIEALSNL